MELHPTYVREVDPTADDSLGKLANLVRPGSVVLELGPAYGYFTRYLVERLGCTVDGVELSPVMAERARRYARDLWIANLDEVDLGERFSAGGYDYVIAADVLEHLRNPWRTLEQCHGLLRPNGRLLLSLPNVGHAALVAELMEGRFEYRDDGLLDRTHLRFFTRRNILDLLRRTGFRVEAMDAVTWMPERTEFRRTLDELPSALRAHLLRHPDALTYQFIVTAGVGEMSAADLVRWGRGDGPARPWFAVRLYWAAEGEEFTEERCLRQYPPMGEARQTVRFELSRPAEAARLRLDPSDRPGFFHLFGLRVEAAGSAGECRRILLEAVGAEQIVAAATLEDIAVFSTDGGGLFLSRSHDPQLVLRELDVRGLAPSDRLLVEVEMDWPMSPDYLVAAAGMDAAVAQESGRLAALRDELAAAARYQANLERQISILSRPRVDVMVVNYNGRRWIDGFMESVKLTSYPADRLRLVFVDNGSTDGSLEYAREKAAELSVPTVFVPTGRNLGFTGGYEQAFLCGDAEYYFVINTDTRMASDAIARLVEVLSADPRVGLAEARQSPREHPKYYDSVTGETSWCSGACVMVRARAFRGVGGGFDRAFFMYAEDVDLSWRMWLHGWKCVYIPDAVVEHFTEDLDPQRDHSVQHYYSMRNGALMRVLYGTWFEALLHYAAMLRVGTLSRNPWWHKRLTLKAVVASLRHLPHAVRKRRSLRRLGRSPWVFFNGWLYGRHARDPSPPDESMVRVTELLTLWPEARRSLDHDLPLDQHVVNIPAVHVGGVRRQAALVYDSGRLEYDLAVPPDAVLAGAVAVPEEVWKASAVGQFEIQQDGQTVWRYELNVGSLAQRQWVPFEVVLSPTPPGQSSCIALLFHGQRDLVWGLWGEPRLLRRASRPAAAQEAVEQAGGLAVSVVVPTHNRADRLPRTIGRLMAQDVSAERFEVVLVDSNSVDATPEVAARLAGEYPNLRTLRCDQPGAAAARNRGLEAAAGSLVVLIDDDILVSRNFVRQVLQAAAVHPGRVLLGRILTCWEGSCDPFHRYLLQVQDVNIYDFPDPTDVPANYFYTACVAIPREVLGGLRFDEGFRVYGVEDIEFGFRLLAGQTRMVYLPELQVLHDYYPTYRVYRRKKYKAGYSLGYFLSQHPEHAGRFQFGRRFRRFYHVLRVLRTLGAPVAGLLYLWERLLYRDGPVNRWLHRWWYADLRIQLYAGLRRFRRGAAPP